LHIHPWSPAQIHAVAQQLSANYVAWVGEQGGDVCAYLIMQTAFDECEILTIGVAQRLQGQGIGQQLWQYAWHDVRQAQPPITTCFLEVRASNLAAQAMYQKCGFTNVGTRKNYYSQPNSAHREDAFIWQKNDPTATVS
jgi:ribosomal-protein-alanine N-acetyltransferase